LSLFSFVISIKYLALSIITETALLNQNPEPLAQDEIDSALRRSGWIIQNKNQINLNTGIGVAVKEYQTNVGPADYILFVDKKPAGVIEAKREEEGLHLTAHETPKIMLQPNSNILITIRLFSYMKAQVR
jgi:hypothetical protein